MAIMESITTIVLDFEMRRKADIDTSSEIPVTPIHGYSQLRESTCVNPKRPQPNPPKGTTIP